MDWQNRYTFYREMDGATGSDGESAGAGVGSLTLGSDEDDLYFGPSAKPATAASATQTEGPERRPCPHPDCEGRETQLYAPSSLRRHARLKHSDEAPIRYVCTFAGCGQTFGRSDHLAEHLRRHTAPKLVCTFCSYETARRQELDKHLEKHRVQVLEARCERQGALYVEAVRQKDAALERVDVQEQEIEKLRGELSQAKEREAALRAQLSGSGSPVRKRSVLAPLNL